MEFLLNLGQTDVVNVVLLLRLLNLFRNISLGHNEVLDFLTTGLEVYITKKVDLWQVC